ncbi:hypothetical protein BDV26DRAFT_287823 [Aspergillus bertholletiae]|uniref:Uncharacterized protein n=1 Tax=Aspergillus bertholletiae TaxID=1226010 RepID=A0A5N7BNG6_9EURO|nr:hypothetical protein BDV26DRAFT_287823 [Aspergillus bertholletiae]
MAKFILTSFAICTSVYRWLFAARQKPREHGIELEEAEREAAELGERCQRLQDQLAERQEMMDVKMSQKDDEIHLLTERLNALTLQPDLLEDDIASLVMNQLGTALGTWVNSNFRDEGRLDGLTAALLRIEMRSLPPLREPVDTDQRRALIRAAVSWHIHDYIFNWLFVGAPSRAMDRDWRVMYTHIREKCPKIVSLHWRSATSMAVQSLSTEYLGKMCDMLCDNIELAFSRFSSSKKERRVRKLRQLIQQCIEFKQRLERQESCYYFLNTAPGEVYAADMMHSAADSQGKCLCVRLSLWPGLAHCTPSETSVVEPEIVWAAESDTEDQSSTTSMAMSM